MALALSSLMAFVIGFGWGACLMGFGLAHAARDRARKLGAAPDTS